jgi:hypothetical protein
MQTELLKQKLETLKVRRSLIEMQGTVLNYQMQEVEAGIVAINLELQQLDAVNKENKASGNDGTSI